MDPKLSHLTQPSTVTWSRFVNAPAGSSTKLFAPSSSRTRLGEAVSALRPDRGDKKAAMHNEQITLNHHGRPGARVVIQEL